MKKIPAIFCDIDGVVAKKYMATDFNYDRFGAPNPNMIKILESLSRDFEIIFITGRWAMGQKNVEEFISSLSPNLKYRAFCKDKDYPGTTAEYKVSIIKELEEQGYEFYLGLDDHSAVVGLMHNHGLFMAHVLSD